MYRTDLAHNNLSRVLYYPWLQAYTKELGISSLRSRGLTLNTFKKKHNMKVPGRSECLTNAYPENLQMMAQVLKSLLPM